MSFKLAFIAGPALKSSAGAAATASANWRSLLSLYARSRALVQHSLISPAILCMALESTPINSAQFSQVFNCGRPPTLIESQSDPPLHFSAQPKIKNRPILLETRLANRSHQVLFRLPTSRRPFTASAKSMGVSEDAAPAPSSGVTEAVAKLREFIGTNEKTDPGVLSAKVLLTCSMRIILPLTFTHPKHASILALTFVVPGCCDK